MFYNRCSFCQSRTNIYNNWYKTLCSSCNFTVVTQDNEKLLQQLKSGFKRTINWNKYEPKVTLEERKRYYDFLINPSFQGVNRLFVLSFENNNGRTSYTRYYLPLVEIMDYNVMIDGWNFFDESVKNDLKTYKNI